MKRVLPIILSIAGLCALYPLQNRMDTVAPHEVISDETLYFGSGKTIKRMSLGLDGLVADIYWIRTVQYFGRRFGENRQEGAVDFRKLRIDLLPDFLNIIVELDPHDIPAYRFGAMFLPDLDPKGAIDLLERGIRDNPNEWRLYQDLGFILWHQNDYQQAAEVYRKGSEIPGALWWMRDLAGLMEVKGGGRAVARTIYEGYLDSEDRNIRDQALRRLKMLQSLDEMDALNAALVQYRSKFGTCPPDLRVFGKWFQQQGAQVDSEGRPVDPDGFPYTLDTKDCKVALAKESPVPRVDKVAL